MADISNLVKATVDAMSDKNDAKINVAKAEVINEVRETVVKEVVVQETGGVDISGLATKDELSTKADASALETKADISLLEAKADKTALDDKADKADLFKNGVFNAGWTAADGSTHYFNAEADDFGGIFAYNKPQNIKSYVGLNKSGEGETIDGQIYSINPDTKLGMRINFGKTGAFYLNGTTNIGTPAGREIAVKDDIPDVSNFLTEASIDDKADKASLEEFKTTVNSELDNKADKTDIPDVSNFVSTGDLDGKADKTDTYTKAEVVSLLEAKANLDEVYKKVDTYSAEKIQELLDLEANKDEVYTISQVDSKLADKADKSDVETDLAKKANKADLFTKNGDGVFSAGWIDTDGSTHRLELEEGDFGGLFAYNKPQNIKSYIGLNKSTENSGFAAIDGQIYSVDKTTAEGMRLNFTKGGTYYTVGAKPNTLDASRELAVKGDIPDVSGFATTEALAEKADISALETVAAEKADKTDIPDISDLATKASVEAKLDADEFNTFKGETNSALADKMEQSDLDTLSTNIGNLLDLKADKSEVSTLDANIALALADKANVSTVTDLANTTNTELGKKADKTDLFKNGVFNTGWTDTDGSTHSFIAEKGDFGGIFSYNAGNNTSSYVGLNKSPANFTDVDVQLYAKDKTSNIGTRVNLSSTHGLYYLKNSTNLGFPAGREVAVKDDIPDVSGYITAAEAQQLIDNAIADVLTQITNQINAQNNSNSNP